MILCIADILTSEQVQTIRAQLAQAEFVNGQVTAGWHARQVKRNTQLSAQAPENPELRKFAIAAIRKNMLFQMAARPRKIARCLFSRYEVGMEYGAHVDNAVMGDASDPIRSDLSFTLFLSAPEDYDGGELIIEDTQGEQAFKLPSGSLVLYPSSTLHRVAPITRGQRLVIVSWVQSLIKDPAQRELLFELDTVRQRVFQQQGKTLDFDILAKCHSNLMRMWAET